MVTVQVNFPRFSYFIIKYILLNECKYNFLSLSTLVMKCSLAAIKEQFELGAYN